MNGAIGVDKLSAHSVSRRPTIADRIEATGGRPTGFDYMRIALSISVVAWHTVPTCYGGAAETAVWASGWRALVGLILPMFFALSGFLVAGSLDRTPELTKFLGLRALRIYPALIAETLLSAFILGPALTTLPIAKYFASVELRQYMLNCLGVIHFHLPGLFIANPLARTVNGQLWTVPFELQCYMLLSLLAFFGLAKRRHALFWTSVVFQIGLLAYKIHFHSAHGLVDAKPGPADGHVLVMVFLAGAVLYALRDKVPCSKRWFIAALAATLVAPFVPWGDYLSAYPMAYVTVFLGLQNPRANTIHKLGDLSYGIFLFGFPIQQVVASMGAWTHHWYINFALALPLTILVALLSWRLVEKPALSLKRHLRVLRPVDAMLERLKGTARAGRLRLFQAYQVRTEGRLTR